MAFSKENPGKGRPPGASNRETKAIREAFQVLIENNLDNMNTWIASIAKVDPARAFDLMIKITEYVLPKLARAELVGDEGKDLFKNVTFTFSTARNEEENNESEDGQEEEGA
jgi:hypothetical protein